MGSVKYHLPDEDWSLLEGVETLACAPEWDGHTSADVASRLRDWITEAKEII